MRTLIAVLLVLVFPASASAGFNSPLHVAGPIDRAEDSVKPERCPKLSNPIECTGGSESSSHNDDSSGGDTNLHRYQHEQDEHHRLILKHYRDRECRYLHIKYFERHGAVVPISLWGLTGCTLWTADNDYHSVHGEASIPRNPSLADAVLSAISA